MKVARALVGVTRIFLDTAPAIYYLEANRQYLSVVTDVLDYVDRGDISAVTSPITLAECLVMPECNGDDRLQQAFVDFIVSGNNIAFTQIDDVVARSAAQIRAQHNLLLPDALQAAVALRTGCDALLTNDPAFRRVPGLNVLVVDDLEL